MGEHYPPDVLAWCSDRNDAGVVLTEESEAAKSARLVCVQTDNVDSANKALWVDPLTTCVECQETIRCKHGINKWYRILDKDLQPGVHRGNCGCNDKQKNKQRGRRIFVMKLHRSKLLPCWDVANQVMSNKTKQAKRKNETHELQTRNCKIAKSSHQTNERLANDEATESRSLVHGDCSWDEHGSTAEDTEVTPATITNITETQIENMIRVCEVLRKLISFARYNCPRCDRSVWSFHIVRGIECLKCMGFEDVQRIGEEAALRIASSAVPCSKEVWQFLFMVPQKLGWMRFLRFCYRYADKFKEVCKKNTEESQTERASLLEVQPDDGTH